MAVKLNLRQQRILDEVITRARKEPGLHKTTVKHGYTYTAARDAHGTIHWRVSTSDGYLLKRGECS
jgi:hypothetical protein